MCSGVVILRNANLFHINWFLIDFFPYQINWYQFAASSTDTGSCKQSLQTKFQISSATMADGKEPPSGGGLDNNVNADISPDQPTVT